MSLTNAARLARRELRGGLQGFRIFLACLALGGAAMAAVAKDPTDAAAVRVMTPTCHESAGLRIQPVQIALSVSDHHQTIVNGGAGQAPGSQALLFPQCIAAALVDGVDDTILISDEQHPGQRRHRIGTGHDGVPVDTSGFFVEDRNLTLKGSNEQAAVLDDQVAINVYQPVQLGTSDRLDHPTLP